MARREIDAQPGRRPICLLRRFRELGGMSSNRGTIPNESCYPGDGMEPNVEQQHLAQEERHDVAHRLFKALCGLYPDRYIALIEPRIVASDQPRARALPAGEVPSAKVIVPPAA